MVKNDLSGPLEAHASGGDTCHQVPGQLEASGGQTNQAKFGEPCSCVCSLESIVSHVKDLVWFLLIPLVHLNLEHKLTCFSGDIYTTYGVVGGGVCGFHREDLGRVKCT